MEEKTSPPVDSLCQQQITHADTPAKAAPYLEDLTCKLFIAHNSLSDPATLEFFRKHVCAEFVFHDSGAHYTPLQRAVGLERYIKNYLNHKNAHPDFDVMPENATASVDKDCQHAVVWVTTKGVNSEKDIGYNRECVSRLQFKRRPEDGAWIWYKHMSVRGGGDYYP